LDLGNNPDALMLAAPMRWSVVMRLDRQPAVPAAVPVVVRPLALLGLLPLVRVAALMRSGPAALPTAWAGVLMASVLLPAGLWPGRARSSLMRITVAEPPIAASR
jgi:hypothetical protein